MARETIEKFTCDNCGKTAEENAYIVKNNKRGHGNNIVYIIIKGREWLSMNIPVKYINLENKKYYVSETILFCPECQRKLMDRWPVIGHRDESNKYELIGEEDE